jgi:hypothetical protein
MHKMALATPHSLAIQGGALPKFPFSRPEGTDPPKEYAELRRKCPIAQVSKNTPRDSFYNQRHVSLMSASSRSSL